jgi:hypothetical protein
MDSFASGRLAGVATRYAAQIEALLNFQAERAAHIAEEAARRAAEQQKVAAAALVSAQNPDASQRSIPVPMIRADAAWAHGVAILFEEGSDAPADPVTASASAPVRSDAASDGAQGVVLDVIC